MKDIELLQRKLNDYILNKYTDVKFDELMKEISRSELFDKSKIGQFKFLRNLEAFENSVYRLYTSYTDLDISKFRNILEFSKKIGGSLDRTITQDFARCLISDANSISMKISDNLMILARIVSEVNSGYFFEYLSSSSDRMHYTKGIYITNIFQDEFLEFSKAANCKCDFLKFYLDNKKISKDKKIQILINLIGNSRRTNAFIAFSILKFLYSNKDLIQLIPKNKLKTLSDQLLYSLNINSFKFNYNYIDIFVNHLGTNPFDILDHLIDEVFYEDEWKKKKLVKDSIEFSKKFNFSLKKYLFDTEERRKDYVNKLLYYYPEYKDYISLM